jgi:hypothetical protein
MPLVRHVGAVEQFSVDIGSASNYLTPYHELMHGSCMPEPAARQKPASGSQTDAIIAKIIALAARNGVEDLHADGVFSDRQAPSLNRRIRDGVYEMLIARRLADPCRHDDPLAQYVDDLGQGHGGGRAVAALQGAVARAVDDFAAAEAIDAATAAKLRKAAVKGAVDAHKTVTRLSLGRSKDEEHDRVAVEFWLRSIPPQWEEPTVSPEFQKMLDRIGSSERPR